jgi:hypothetical protein
MLAQYAIVPFVAQAEVFSLKKESQPARTLPTVWVELPSLSGTVGAGTGCDSGQETIAYASTNRRGDSGVSGPSPWDYCSRN